MRRAFTTRIFTTAVDNLVITANGNSNVGNIMVSGSKQSVNTTKTTFVLIREPLSKGGYTIITAYPDL